MEIKRLGIIIMIIASIALAMVAGREMGIRHAIEDSQIEISEFGISITLDGNLYIHNLD